MIGNALLSSSVAAIGPPPFLPGEVGALLWINHHRSPFLDAFMYMISQPWAWMPLALALIVYLFYKRPWQEGALVLLGMILVILLCDGLSSHIAKPLFARPRPSHYSGIASEVILTYHYRGGLYGFFSGHAANYFGIVSFLSLVFRRRLTSVLLFTLAVIVAYSRLYLGVHFISDILAGIFVGLGTGYIVYLVYSWLRRRFHLRGYADDRAKLGRVSYTRLFHISIFMFLLYLISYSVQVAQILAR